MANRSLTILLLHPDGASETWEMRLLQQLDWESPQAGLETFPALAAHRMFTIRVDDRSCHW